MYEYKEFNEKMKKNYLDKGTVIDVLNSYVNGSGFLQHLEKFKSKETERNQILGVIYSEDYEKDDDEYFGENKVLFYAGDDCYDIIDYDELYLYLYFTCEFYIEKHENKKEIVQEKLLLIEEAYGIE
ncbi:ribonuclease toxin immunity protein CdiI [uncultured Clostridium sp.]|uniref:ribonuclease toxin immunity protein CdiI n=1 Tax=uncultured Clostridium sp. TaxID=59620 RepID=UPI0028E90186|nr:ribonuclease toxin immunity protein CdiI [uncultured Clostridium sp.]